MNNTIDLSHTPPAPRLTSAHCWRQAVGEKGGEAGGIRGGGHYFTGGGVYRQAWGRLVTLRVGKLISNCWEL